MNNLDKVNKKYSKKINEKCSKKFYSRSDKAITLIALIVTIIILLILVAIVISTVSRNGIIEKAKIATKRYSNSAEKENNLLRQLNQEIDNQTTEQGIIAQGMFWNAKTGDVKSIEWGKSLPESMDNVKEIQTSDSKTKVYAWQDGEVYYFYSKNDKPIFKGYFDIIRNSGCKEMIESVSGLSHIDIGTDLFYNELTNAFTGCASLKSLDGLQTWDTSKITSLSYLFSYCENLEDISALENWNVSKVKSCDDIFYNDSKLQNLDGLRNWSTDSLNTLNFAFMNCKGLNDISGMKNWNFSNVTSLTNTFYGCSSLTDISALSNWDVSNVTSTYQMFKSCSQLQDTTPLKKWNTSKMTDIYEMFEYDDIQNLSGLENWDVSNVERMYALFYYCKNLTDDMLTPLKKWKLKDGVSMDTMFSGTKVTYSDLKTYQSAVNN